MSMIWNKKYGVIMVLLAVSCQTLAAAWVRAPGETLMALGVSYTSANKVYDDAGNTPGIPRFTEIATNFYGEHGVSERLTLGAMLPVLNLHSAENTTLLANERRHTGIGDSVASGQYLLVQGPVLVSAGLDLGLPTGNKNAAIATGDGEFSFMPKVSAAGGFQIGLPVFYLLSTGYHKRTVGFSDEIYGQLMGGFRASFVTFIFSLEARQSLKNGDAGLLSTNPLYYNNASFFSYAPGIVLHAGERLAFNLFYKSGFLVRNILGAPSISAGVSYVF
ncbi:hypothetical protein [Turneriella parva]|uniref:Transporter n=1 Tax=Turneriella parva (strain ATCC BAA-1111 / DSM 21527 / NCTC 11395 / H) TaxID=869212 RepID=I4B1Y8_TURPD|nr:hypothetical protein [Turneriella parva]AFM11295.1 hypothetical protein Turpa_0643 [Turneriella parva DSM 21527]